MINDRLQEFRGHKNFYSSSTFLIGEQNLQSPLSPPLKGIELSNSNSSNDIDVFIAKIKTIKTQILRLNSLINEVERLHNQVISGALNFEESNRISQHIDEIINSKISSESLSLKSSLTVLTEETNRLANPPQSKKKISNSDLRIRISQQSRYSKKFLESMQRLKGIQERFATKYRTQLKRQYLIIKPEASQVELDQLINGTTNTPLNQKLFSLASKVEAHTTLEAMKERHKEIEAIERSALELNQMFIDINTIVGQQGEQIERVQESMHAAEAFTELAIIEMEGTRVRHIKSQKRRWMYMALFVGVLCAIAITLSVVLGGN